MAKNLSSVMKEMLKTAKEDPDLKNKNFERLESLLSTINDGLEKLAKAHESCTITQERLEGLVSKLEPILAQEHFVIVQTCLSMILTFGAIDAGMSKNAFLGYMESCYIKYEADSEAESDSEEDDE